MVLEVVFEQTNSETTVDFGQTTEVVPGNAPIYFAPVAKVDQLQDGALLTIQDKNGTTTAKVKNGSNGKDGTSVTHSWNGTILTITSASGTSSTDLKGSKGDKGDKGDPGDDGHTPERGIDYYTEADKKEMVNAVIAALPVYNGEVIT